MFICYALSSEKTDLEPVLYITFRCYKTKIEIFSIHSFTALVSFKHSICDSFIYVANHVIRDFNIKS